MRRTLVHWFAVVVVSSMGCDGAQVCEGTACAPDTAEPSVPDASVAPGEDAALAPLDAAETDARPMLRTMGEAVAYGLERRCRLPNGDLCPTPAGGSGSCGEGAVTVTYSGPTCTVTNNGTGMTTEGVTVTALDALGTIRRSDVDASTDGGHDAGRRSDQDAAADAGHDAGMGRP